MLPGLRASMWRVLADPAPGGHGVGISEITFYRASVDDFCFTGQKGRVVPKR